MRAAVHLVLMVVVGAGLAFAVIAGSSPRQANLDLDSGLLVSNRQEFRVCVELAPALRPDRAALVERLDAAFDALREHPDWVPAGLGAAPPSLTLGCPRARPPAGLGGPARGDRSGAGDGSGGVEGRTGGDGARVLGEPSPFRVWVYVLDDATADRLLGPGLDTASTAAEHLAAGEGRIAEVSTAVLVRTSRLADPAFADGDLAAAAGLRPGAPEPAAPPAAK